MSDPNANTTDDFVDFLQQQVTSVRERKNAAAPIDVDYRDLELIGEGAQKRIFSAYDPRCCRRVAMALLKQDSPAARDQFIREARITALLQHPAIMPVYEHGYRDGKPYFTMRQMDGDTLADLIPRQPPQTIDTAVVVAFARVCEAVSYAHATGVIHRDLKPANVQLGRFGQVLVSDWGLAALDFENCDPELLDDENLRAVDLKVSSTGTVKGTPGFIAPELLAGSNAHSAASDQFALGATLHLLLTGTLPFDCATAEGILRATTAGRINPFANATSVPDSLQAVCRKALAHRPADRYPSVADMLADLNAYLTGFATNAEAPGIWTQLRLFYARNKAICLTAFFSIAVLSITVTTAFRAVVARERTASRLVTELQAANETVVDRERTASRLLTELQATNALQAKLKRQSAPAYAEQAEAALLNDDLNSAIALARSAHEYDPNNLAARSIYARTLLARQEFAAAADVAAGHLDKVHTIATTFAARKTSNRLARPDLVDLLKTLDPDNNRDLAYVYRVLLFEEFQRLTTFDQKLALMRDEIRYRNPQVDNLHFTGSETNGVHQLDLSNNPKLTNVYVLEKLGPITVSELNLSNTPILNGHNTSRLRLMQIDTLIMRNCQASRLDAIALGLRTLDACGAGDVSPYLKGSQIEELLIAGSHFRNYAVLTTMPKLRRLTVSRGKLPPAIAKALRNNGCQIIQE